MPSIEAEAKPLPMNLQRVPAHASLNPKESTADSPPAGQEQNPKLSISKRPTIYDFFATDSQQNAAETVVLESTAYMQRGSNHKKRSEVGYAEPREMRSLTMDEHRSSAVPPWERILADEGAKGVIDERAVDATAIDEKK